MRLLPTAMTRFGAKDSVNFTVSLYRAINATLFDALNYALYIPVAGIFGIELGNGLLPRASMFAAGLINTEDITLKIKAATSLDYYDSNLRHVSLSDSQFYSAAAMYRW